MSEQLTIDCAFAASEAARLEKRRRTERKYKFTKRNPNATPEQLELHLSLPIFMPMTPEESRQSQRVKNLRSRHPEWTEERIQKRAAELEAGGFHPNGKPVSGSTKKRADKKEKAEKVEKVNKPNYADQHTIVNPNLYTGPLPDFTDFAICLVVPKGPIAKEYEIRCLASEVEAKRQHHLSQGAKFFSRLQVC